MKPFLRLSPFRQGELDGLCGIYAVINAVRLIIGEKAGRFSNDDWQAFFAALLFSTDDTVGAATAAACGIETKPFLQVLKSAVRHLRQEHDVRMKVRPLLTRPNSPSFLEFLDIVRAECAEPNQAIIVTVEGFSRTGRLRAPSVRRLSGYLTAAAMIGSRSLPA